MSDERKRSADGGTVVVVNADTMGRGDDWLGARLVGSFLRSMASVDPALATIVFYNAGVKVLGPGSTHLALLRELRETGVDLLACVTCLDFYDLANRIEVGRVSNMLEIAQRMATADRVVTI